MIETALVETDWLANHLDAPDVVVVDGSWHLPNTGRNAYEEYLETHIPGAMFFDIDKISDQTSPLPHMLPGAEEFSGQMGEMGIGEPMRVVVYDSHGLFSAARVWWMFKVMGHKQVGVLNGGLPKWLKENRPTQQGKPRAVAKTRYRAALDDAAVRDGAGVLQALEDNTAQILDARPKGRFDGIDPEPRPDLKSGHMPGSANLHYAALLTEDGLMKDAAQLKLLFAQAGIDLSRPVITTCGSGVTAAILTLGLHLLDHGDCALYDGSWTDWASTPGRPIENT